MVRNSERTSIIGIKEIASYIPENRVDNIERGKRFGVDETFLTQKLGVREVALRHEDEDTSDLCVKAYERLRSKVALDTTNIDVLVVITQNPDTNVPHTSAIVHGRLGLRKECACFDISLACSGYPYGLSIVQSFMKENGFRKGLLFTCDPYSKIIDKDDKNTSLLFGDAATVTLISDAPVYTLEDVTFGTVGSDYNGLIFNKRLWMNGRAMFNLVLRHVPDDIDILLKKSGLRISEIDRFVFHQASKYIIDSLSKTLKIGEDKVVFDIYEYGNTVSSSIPIILEKEIRNRDNRIILISGFGAGLSYSSGILRRV